MKVEKVTTYDGLYEHNKSIIKLDENETIDFIACLDSLMFAMEGYEQDFQLLLEIRRGLQ